MNPQNRDNPSPLLQARRPSPWWWLVIVAVLLAWNLVAYVASRNATSVSIPYSTFVSEVESGNVTSVTLSGSEIAGEFKTPYKEKKQSYHVFTTVFPAEVGDRGLMPLLLSHKVAVKVNPPAQPWLGALIGWIPLVLLLGFFWWSMRRAGSGANSAMSFGRSRAQRYQLDRSRVTFDDVADAEEAKTELQEEVDFLRHPQKYHAIGARI